jgi:hypothetical protein
VLKVVTRDEAAKEGLKKYFTGIACKHGHICERWVNDANCFECNAVKVKKWQKNNKEKLSAYKRENRKKNPDKVREQERKYRSHNREESKELRKKYSANLHKRFRAKQVIAAGRDRPDVCEVCNEKDVRICYDHCHKTGLFRGWLCVRCNSTLGFVKDDIKLLAKLGIYLKRFEGSYELHGN